MALVKLRQNTWINPEKVVQVKFDEYKKLSYVYLEGLVNDPLVVEGTPDDVQQLLAANNKK